MATKEKKNLDNWKFPKIPVHKLYKKNPFLIFPSYAIKDFSETITLTPRDTCRTLDLLPLNLLRGFIKKKHKFLHLGLVQVSIKPLVRDGLESPIVVGLRDARQRNFKNSVLAVVRSNLSDGPIYFNCFPSFSVSKTDVFISGSEPLNLFIMTTEVPLALTYRIVCKAMVDLSAQYLEKPTLGKTIYYHATSGNPATSIWDEVVQGAESTEQTPDESLTHRSVSPDHGVRRVLAAGSFNGKTRISFA